VFSLRHIFFCSFQLRSWEIHICLPKS